MRERASTGDRIARPEPVVCLAADGTALPRITPADAEILVAKHWAEWRGKGTRRHLRLTDEAPLRQLSARTPGVRRVRSDGALESKGGAKAGQGLGHEYVMEHRPL